jgi:hypothetical protein
VGAAGGLWSRSDRLGNGWMDGWMDEEDWINSDEFSCTTDSFFFRF